ncbi:MAG TPA: TerC family protein [Bacteroidia bacterium]|nr:TerC family protein [Bacteroidia bacterium]
MNFQEQWQALFSVSGLISLLVLSVLEIILGIDNIIFISIVADKLPKHQKQRGRITGLALALVMRAILLFSITWLASLTKPWFSVFNLYFSGRDIILLAGGIFLIVKTIKEIIHKIYYDEEELSIKGQSTFSAIVLQIVMIDIVFSFDSILTAVGLSRNFIIMFSAVIIAMILMMLFSGVVADFINKNQGIKTIALTFLVVIGGMLVAESVLSAYNYSLPKDQHIELNKNYAYAALAFALISEWINIKEQRVKRDKSLFLDNDKKQ